MTGLILEGVLSETPGIGGAITGLGVGRISGFGDGGRISGIVGSGSVTIGRTGVGVGSGTTMTVGRPPPPHTFSTTILAPVVNVLSGQTISLPRVSVEINRK